MQYIDIFKRMAWQSRVAVYESMSVSCQQHSIAG